MKNGKAPTKAQKIMMRASGLDPEKYLVIKNTPECLEVVSRIELKKQGLTGRKPRIRRIDKKLY